MNYTNKKDDNGMTFDIPSREGTEGYVGMFFGLYLKVGTMLTAEPKSNSTYNIQQITQFLISLVAGKEKRTKIRTQLKENIETEIKTQQEKKGKNNLDRIDIDSITQQCCLEIIGEITDFIDEHVGVSVENRLGGV